MTQSKLVRMPCPDGREDCTVLHLTCEDDDHAFGPVDPASALAGTRWQQCADCKLLELEL